MANPACGRSVSLPPELWHFIADNLEFSSIKNMTEVSKDLNTFFTPSLYRNVNLSVHHYEPIIEDDYIVQRWPSNIRYVFAQQSFFMRQIFNKPEYASMVRSFTWTMGLHRLCNLPEWAKEDDSPIQELENIYALFALMDQVTFVDIGGGPIHPYLSDSSHLTSLFPNATHISLSGQMHYALASAILHGQDKAPLTSLRIGCLLERGRVRSGENYIYRKSGREMEEDWPEDSNPIQIYAGCMRRVFNLSLQSRCRDLSDLTLCYLDLDMLRHRNNIPPGWNYLPDETHEEWTSFLKVVQPQHLTIEYFVLCMERLSELQGRTCRLPRPGNRVFDHILLPVLHEAWPGLRTLDIHGVWPGRWTFWDRPEPPHPCAKFNHLTSVNVRVDTRSPQYWDRLRRSYKSSRDLRV
ncbi:hypothetical protein MW887_011575 [Aspergillus wentii]|nr:hypothetical protein MW887_011575 [Aspergillus wentii]